MHTRVDLDADPARHPDWLHTIDTMHPDICLLPPAIYGWSFAVKKWGSIFVEYLSAIPFNHGAFENLVLPEDNKKLIKSLIETQAKITEAPILEDGIKGKGTGLVILLHGGPGSFILLIKLRYELRA
jgi:hypothetical protein